jgi:hypothetical protein
LFLIIISAAVVGNVPLFETTPVLGYDIAGDGASTVDEARGNVGICGFAAA